MAFAAPWDTGTQEGWSEETRSCRPTPWASSQPHQVTSPLATSLLHSELPGGLRWACGEQVGEDTQGFISFKRKSPVNSEIPESELGKLELAILCTHTCPWWALTWAPLMSLAEGLGASALESSEFGSRPGLKQRRQAGLDGVPGKEIHTDQGGVRMPAGLLSLSNLGSLGVLPTSEEAHVALALRAPPTALVCTVGVNLDQRPKCGCPCGCPKAHVYWWDSGEDKGRSHS